MMDFKQLPNQMTAQGISFWTVMNSAKMHFRTIMYSTLELEWSSFIFQTLVIAHKSK